MSNVDVVRRFYEEMNNGRKLDIASEIMTPDHQYHDPNSPAAVGPDSMAEIVRVYQTSVDGHWGIQEIIDAGDYVTVRWIGTGTHIGEINGIQPSGRKVEVDAISIHRMQDGKIAENWTVWDTLRFLRQLGVIPDVAGAAADEVSIEGSATVPTRAG